MTFEEQWGFVTEEINIRPELLPGFDESSGITFSLLMCSMPCDVHKNKKGTREDLFFKGFKSRPTFSLFSRDGS